MAPGLSGCSTCSTPLAQTQVRQGSGVALQDWLQHCCILLHSSECVERASSIGHTADSTLYALGLSDCERLWTVNIYL